MALSKIPWDRHQVTDMIKTLIIQHKLNIPVDNSEKLFTMALALSAAAKKTFFEKAEIRFSNEPDLVKAPIIHFKGRMRVDVLEKFNNPTACSVIHYYKNTLAMESGKAPLGMLIVYVERVYLPELLRLLQYPYIDSEDEFALKDGCGALVNLIGGHFKKELIALGYQDLEMSHFKSFVNVNMDGIEAPVEQLNKYEVSFDIDGKKRMVAELVMGDIT